MLLVTRFPIDQPPITMIKPKLIQQFLVEPGTEVNLKHYVTDWTETDEAKELGKDVIKERAAEILEENRKQLDCRPGTALRQRHPLGAADFPGDGCRRQGRHHPARHVRRQSAGLPGLQFQEAVRRGTRPQFPLALHEGPARARPHRHLQPLVLRGRARRQSPSGMARPRPARRTGQEVLGEALRGHQQLRETPVPQRHAGAQVLPPCLERTSRSAASSSA